MSSEVKKERIRVIKQQIKYLQHQQFDMFNDVYSMTPRVAVEEEIEVLQVVLKKLLLDA